MDRTLTITVSDGTFSAYVAKPKSGSGPVVVLLQEVFGVNASIRTIAGEMAREGFLIVCPDLYWRVAPGIELSDRIEAEARQAFELCELLDVDRALDDVHATVKAARPFSSTDKVGVMGFCLGGLLAILMSARYHVDAAVSYYGSGTDKYADELRRVNGPLLMHLAGNDEYMGPAARKKIQAALAGSPSVEIELYPDRQHAFARPGGNHYNAADASLAKQRTVQFLRKHLMA